MPKIIIAIDGFSSTGKSTVARQLAEAVDYIYIDTGAMYRAITLFALRNDLIADGEINRNALLDQLPSLQLNFKLNPKTGAGEIFLNNENISQETRTMRVSNYVSEIAAIPEVRHFLVEKQQAMGKEKGLVMDGRDIGTVVFPKAELKIFMTATAQKRAERRYDELKAKGEKVNFKDVLKNIQKRDHRDTTREDSPLKKAKDAREIDTSNLSKQEQFEQLLSWAREEIDS